MSKELEALKELRSFCGDVYFREIYDKDYQIIEIALKDYETMKEIRYTSQFDLKQVNKEHKALEIITSISKQTTHFRLKERQNFGEDEMSYYLVIDNCEYRLKDKEQYDLLKEVLL